MNSAVISECESYRYRLDRDVQSEGLVFAYFGINPSTADASTDDATVRKWRGFTMRNGGSRFIVGNVFSLRSTDVKGLDSANRRHVPVMGIDHDRHIGEIIAEADILIPCWGATGKIDRNLRPCIGDLYRKLHASGKPVMTFGFTASGDPKHPLMLGYSTPLTDWSSK